MIRAGLKRLGVLVLGLCVFTASVSLVIALATGTPAFRAVSLGFMLVGSFLFVIGAAVGLRGPARPVHRPDGSLSGLTLAHRSDRITDINVSYLLVGIGLALVLIGIAADPHVRLL